MAKRVPLAIPNVRVNETSLAVLRVIANRALHTTGVRCGRVPISLREMSSLVSTSEQTIRRSCSALCDEGLLLRFEGWLDNGGQEANSYEITALGLEVLRQTEE